MPKNEPLDAGEELKASYSDLAGFQWQTNCICADFSLLGDEEHLLRVSFDRPCIVHLVDEMPLSTEEDEAPDEGLIAERFAYPLEGERFAPFQSEAWKEVSGRVAHYQFVTGWACTDVLSGGSPTFSVVARAG